MSDIASRIARARTGASLTQSELACAVGVKRSAVAQWELRDGTRPTTSHLVVIAKITGVNLEWLATGRGAQSPGVNVCPISDVFDLAKNDAESRMLEAMKLLSRAKQELALKMVGLLLRE